MRGFLELLPGFDLESIGFRNAKYALQSLVRQPKAPASLISNPQLQKKQDPDGSCFFGAVTGIWTRDLVLTKDVLYRLSHSSTLRCCVSSSHSSVIYERIKLLKYTVFVLGKVPERSEGFLQLPSSKLRLLLYNALLYKSRAKKPTTVDFSRPNYFV